MEEKQDKGFSVSKLGAGIGATVMAVASQAAIEKPDFASNVTDLGVILGAAIGFAAVVWGGRKLLSFIG